MKDTHLFTDSASIQNVKKELLAELEEIKGMLSEALLKVEETKEFFDTPTATYFREKVDKLVGEEKIYINNQVIPWIEILDSFAKIYGDAALKIKNQIENQKA